jgi:tetratricopeptide (TPR) repeat protein
MSKRFNKAIKRFLCITLLCLAYGVQGGQKPLFMQQAAWQQNIEALMSKQPDSAFVLLNKASRWAEEKGDTEVLAWVFKRRGTLFYYLLRNDQAISNYLRALELYEALGDSLRIAGMYMNLGNVAGSKRETIAFYLRSIALHRKINNPLGVAKNLVNVGTTYLDYEEIDSAKGYFEEALALSRKEQLVQTRTSSLLNLAIVYEHEGNVEKAISSVKEVLQYAEEPDFNMARVYGFYNLSQFYLRLNKLDSSLFYTDRALELAQHSFSGIQERCFENYRTVYRVQGDFEKALYYQKLKDSIAILNDATNSEKLFSRMETEHRLTLKEAQVEKLDREMEVSAQINWMLVLLIGSSVVFGATAVLLQRDRARKEEALLQQEHLYVQSKKHLAEAVLRSAELKEERLNARLKHTRSELQSFAMNFVQNNEVLAMLKRSVAALIKSAATRKEEKALQDFDASLRALTDRDEAKRAFLEKAMDLYNEFLAGVEKKYPDLNATERELLVLIALQLGYKEIASIYNVKPATVVMNRYKLRKKMSVPHGESFEYFLRKHIYGA